MVSIGEAAEAALAELTVGPPPPPLAPPPAPPKDDDRPDQVRRWMRVAGIPDRYLDARFANWQDRPGTRKAFEASTAVADQPHNLILVGPWGTGKTRLAASIIAARIERWLEAYPDEVIRVDAEGLLTRPPFASRFRSVPQLLDAIRRSYEYDDEPDPLDELRRVPLLILDDLGREKATDWVLERLYVLIDDRYGESRPTVVTTNYSLMDLARRDYGAMVSRLTEDGAVVKIGATDARPGEAA
jgi:DNA replication protein DnaC